MMDASNTSEYTLGTVVEGVSEQEADPDTADAANHEDDEKAKPPIAEKALPPPNSIAHKSFAAVVMGMIPFWKWRSRTPSGALLMGVYNESELKSHALHYACYESDYSAIRQLSLSRPLSLQEKLPSCGETPLHVACRTDAPRKIVEFLVQTDIQHNTSSRGHVVVEAQSTSLFMASKDGDTPLHLAAEQGNTDAMKVILVTADLSHALKEALTRTNKDGNTALHLAALAGHLAAVESLLEAMSRLIDEMVVTDNNRSTTGDSLTGSRPLYMANNSGNLPIHLTLRLRQHTPSGTRYDKVPLWTALLLADRKETDDDGHRTLHAKDRQGLSAFDFFVQHPSHLTREFVDEFLSKDVLSNYLEKGWQHLGGTRHWNIELAGSIARQPELQTIMAEACSNRLPVLTFMADFYAHVLSIYVFYIATEIHLENFTQREDEMSGPRAIPRNLIFVCAGYFLLREVIQWRLARKVYWTDVWNYLDLIRIALMTTAANMLASYDYDDPFRYDDDYESTVRKVLLTTGVFLYLGAISFLRATFLPFALFVGGTSEIIVTLIPFLVSFGLALLCIAYGFWVGGFNETTEEFADYTTYTDWLFTVFLRSMDGDGPSDFTTLEKSYINPYGWTLIFAILIQLLLLNVLIAVIASEWEGVTARQTEVFWQYRLDFVAGSFPVQRGFLNWVTNSSPTLIRTAAMALANFADSPDDLRILDKIHWDVFPFSVVRDEPGLYWDREALIARLKELEPRKSKEELDEQVGVIRSFQADMAHEDTNSWCAYLDVLARLVGYIAVWILLFILGCLTLGLMWPRRVRNFFFGQASSSWNVFQRGGAGGGAQGGGMMSSMRGGNQNHLYERDYASMKEGFDKQYRSMSLQLTELNNAVDKLTSIVAMNAQDREQEKEPPRSLLRSISIGSNSTKPPMRKLYEEEDERSA